MSNMKLCEPHSVILRVALEDAKLGHLINHNLEVQRQIFERLQYGRGRGDMDFDVWVLAQLRLAQQLSNCMHPRHMVDSLPDGTCPLCMAVREGGPLIGDSWLRGVVKELEEEAAMRGLLRASTPAEPG